MKGLKRLADNLKEKTRTSRTAKDDDTVSIASHETAYLKWHPKLSTKSKKGKSNEEYAWMYPDPKVIPKGQTEFLIYTKKGMADGKWYTRYKPQKGMPPTPRVEQETLPTRVIPDPNKPPSGHSTTAPDVSTQEELTPLTAGLKLQGLSDSDYYRKLAEDTELTPYQQRFFELHGHYPQTTTQPQPQDPLSTWEYANTNLKVHGNPDGPAFPPDYNAPPGTSRRFDSNGKPIL